MDGMNTLIDLPSPTNSSFHYNMYADAEPYLDTYKSESQSPINSPVGIPSSSLPIPLSLGQ